MYNDYYSRREGEGYRKVTRPFSTNWFESLKGNRKALNRFVGLLLLVMSNDTPEARNAIEGVFLSVASFLQADGRWSVSSSDQQWELFDIACQELYALLNDPSVDDIEIDAPGQPS